MRTSVYSASHSEQIILDFNIDQQTITSTHITSPTHHTAISGLPAPGISNTRPFLPNQVIGPTDDRTRVADTSLYPWSAVAQIEYIDPNNIINICTGWMLGQSTVVTAAHCVYLVNANGGSAGWGKTYRVRPGRDGSTIRWECAGFYAHVPQPWVDAVNAGQGRVEASRRYDWAGIDLRCRIGETTGVLGVRSTNDSDLNQQAVAVTGYAGNHPPPPVDPGTSMWTGSGNLVASTAPGVLRYTVDTTAGESGAPVWQTENIPSGCSSPCVVGGDSAEESDGVTPNYGYRVTPAVLDEFVLWKQYSYPMLYLPMIIK